MKRQSTTGVRFLTGCATLVALLGICFGLFTIQGAMDEESHNVLDVHHKIDGRHLQDLPKHVIRPARVDVTSKLTDPSLGDKRLASARDLGKIALIVAFAFLARSILLSVRDGDPFTETNIGRIRAVGFLFLVGVPLVGILSSKVNTELAHSLDGNLATSTGISFTGPFVSIAVFALAELFAQGARLRQDVEGTV